MLNLNDYDKVVSQIYEAALVPAYWDVALTSMINLFGPREWETAMVVWERIDPPMGRFIGAAGVHELARPAYLTYFAGQSVWSVRGHDVPVGHVFHTDDLISREELRATSFYQNYLKPWGLEVAIMGSLDRHDKAHMAICCPGPPDLDPGDLFEAVVRLTPHFQRAARISRRIGEADMRAATATDLLDTSPYSVMALDANLQVLLANAKAELLLEIGVGAAPFQRQLTPEDSSVMRQLRAMASGKCDERSVTFTARMCDGSRVLISALAVSREQGGQFASNISGTALMIIGGQRADISDDVIDALQNCFGLTGAEARLAAFLIEGSGVQGYANYRSVSIEASKYLLKSIYAKTGLSDKTELIALLREAPLGWGSPLSLPAR
ncbi:MAG: helix-turn-helix transcriptional regulator [Sphingorhabdus sp.]